MVHLLVHTLVFVCMCACGLDQGKCLRHLGLVWVESSEAWLDLGAWCAFGLGLGAWSFKGDRLSLWAHSLLSASLSSLSPVSSLFAQTLFTTCFGFVFLARVASVSRRIRGEASPGLRLRVDAKFARNGGGFLARVR